MMKTLTAALFVGTLSTAASAVTLDFVAEAFGNERGVANGTTINYSGLGVTFSATSNGNPAFAYFDDLSSNLPAGLGVCTTLTTAAQCQIGSDDNITTGEAVTLAFDQTVELSGFSFNNHAHLALPAAAPTSSLAWAINGGALQSTTFAAFVSQTLTGVNSITFGYGDERYYLSILEAKVSAIPLPAGILLMGTALGGLGLTRRKKKAA